MSTLRSTSSYTLPAVMRNKNTVDTCIAIYMCTKKSTSVVQKEEIGKGILKKASDTLRLRTYECVILIIINTRARSIYTPFLQAQTVDSRMVLTGWFPFANHPAFCDDLCIFSADAQRVERD